MSKRLFILGIVFLCMVFAINVYGDSHKGQKKDCASVFLQNHDADNNGSVDLAEMTDTAKKDFKKLDTNNDGVIDKKDGKSFLKESDIAIIDRDKNGNITVEEYVIYFTDNFNKSDKNKDGKLHPNEICKKEKASK